MSYCILIRWKTYFPYTYNIKESYTSCTMNEARQKEERDRLPRLRCLYQKKEIYLFCEIECVCSLSKLSYMYKLVQPRKTNYAVYVEDHSDI